MGSYWPDLSKYTHNGRIYGAKLREGTVYFNGINNYIDIPNDILPSPQAFTIATWIYPLGENSDASYDEQIIVDLRGQYKIFLSWKESDDANHPACLRGSIYGGGEEYNLYSPDNSLPPGLWHFVGMSWDGTTQRICYNGNFLSQPANDPASITGYESLIGKDYQLDWDRLWFFGFIGELFIFSVGFDEERFRILYNLTFPFGTA